MPSRLSELQHALHDALLGGDAGPVRDAVLGDGLAPDARLALYRHHVFTTLTEALAATFPVVCRLVHTRFFAYAADRYIRDHPPTSPCLFEYGADFAEFLAAFNPAQHLAYLPDVARLEWAINCARHAGDAAPIDPAQLRSIPPEAMPRLVARLDPSLFLLESRWPIDRIWSANQCVDTAGSHDNGAPEPPPIVDLGEGDVSVEVRRRDDDVSIRRLAPDVHAFRAALVAGRTLADATDAALASNPSFDLVRGIRDLLLENALTSFHLAEPGAAEP
jgi:hypothetical protein